jgi:CTP-dependent riboflavin kinase
MKEPMKLSGIIQGGAGRGAFFTGLDWVARQCRDLLGYEPFPGTLNVHIRGQDLPVFHEFLSKADGFLVPDDPAFCKAGIKKIRVNGLPAAVVLPSEDVRIHDATVIEIMSSCSIKETLGLENGDPVVLTSFDSEESG